MSTASAVKSSTAGVIDTVGEAVSAGAQTVQDLAGTAVELAGAAAEKVPEIPEHVAGLVRTTQRRLRPQPPPRRISPWLLVAAAIAGALAVYWWRRRPTDVEVDRGPGWSENPVREHTADAMSAARN